MSSSPLKVETPLYLRSSRRTLAGSRQVHDFKIDSEATLQHNIRDGLG